MMPCAVLPHIGSLSAGSLNSISDVAGVKVGHCTLNDGAVQTGVTAVLPHGNDLFQNRVPAAAVVLNGFGKSIGLVQLQELGLLETPIALTNTFSVPAIATAQIRQCIATNPETGRTLSTVNPLVFECNDGFLNDIQRLAVTEQHYQQACDSASTQFEQGAVGAGRGMTCFGLKGGIGSASRCVQLPGGQKHTVGALVLSNFGKPLQMLWAGQAVGGPLAQALAVQQGRTEELPQDEPEKGSIILLIATDAPLDARQLRRLAMRAGAGLARTGSVFGHGSGDIALAFSTAYTVPQAESAAMPAMAMLHDGVIDDIFQAVADSTEQAILHSLWYARGVTGRDGHQRTALVDLCPRA